MHRSQKDSRKLLYEIATTQGGYFTVKQAATAGYSRQHLKYHTLAGNFERVGVGLYRIPILPLHEHDEMIQLSLWSRDRSDRPQAVVSHQSALALLDLSDVLPQKIYLTVPPLFRKKVPQKVKLYKGHLKTYEIQEYEGYFATTALRSLIDVSADTTMGQELIYQALNEALTRGLFRQQTLIDEIKNHPRAVTLTKMITDMKHD